MTDKDNITLTPRLTLRCAVHEFCPKETVCVNARKCLDYPIPLKSHDPINPPHYKSHPSGVECIQIVRHLTFNLGNAMKYIWRAGKKGSAITDLEKAIWHLQDEVKRLKGDSK